MGTNDDVGALGRFNLLLELADFEWSSQTFRVSETREFSEVTTSPEAEAEVATPPEEAEDLLTEIEELIPELDNTEIDIIPDLEKPKVSLEPLKPAKIGEEDGTLLEPLKAPEVEASLAELGRHDPVFAEVAEGRVIIEEGSISADVPDPDSFLKDAAVRGANGLEENGLMKGYTELGRYLNFDVDQLDKGRAALPSDLLFEFNNSELKQNAKLGLMKLGMLIDRNPQMYCILEGKLAVGLAEVVGQGNPHFVQLLEGIRLVAFDLSGADHGAPYPEGKDKDGCPD